MPFDHKMYIGHCDLVSWFSDFALDLQDHVMYKHNAFG